MVEIATIIGILSGVGMGLLTIIMLYMTYLSIKTDYTINETSS